jgi:hypothetical protein
MLIPFLSFSQNTITVLDKKNKTPLIGVHILSKEGSFLLSTDNKGVVNIGNLEKAGIKDIIIYDPNYNLLEYKINKVPKIIYLEERKAVLLETITIKSKQKRKKYFIVHGYIRSWQLVNNKLIKYGDALVEYHIPYKKQKNGVVTGIKNYITGYRTFKTDSIKQKSRIISFSRKDNFLDYHIPRRNILIRQNYENYKIAKNKDSLYNIYKKNKKIGYVTYNKEKLPIRIIISENSKENEEMKSRFWELSASSKNIEKWVGKDLERHLSYSSSSEKILIETKLGDKVVETINEIFINNKISYNLKKPKKSKRFLDIDRSFYIDEYWEKQILKHQLPSNIKKQLTSINENKNTY